MDGKPVAAEIWALTLQEWMRLAPNLAERGRWFRGRLGQELERHGAAVEGAQALAWQEDKAHDRHIGAAVDMLLGGQPLKGDVFFNRFALLAGHHPIDIVSMVPLAIDIGTAVIVMRENDVFIPSMPEPSHQEEAVPCQ